MVFDLDNIVWQPVQVYYLELAEKTAIKAADTEGVAIRALPTPLSVSVYRQYYGGVGYKYQWLDRLVMADEMLLERINADNTFLFDITWNDTSIGFLELVRDLSSVEILYFGLFDAAIGKGFGKKALNAALQKAWSIAEERPKIVLNTCSLDHPNALNTYKSCGFQVIKTETELRRVRLF